MTEEVVPQEDLPDNLDASGSEVPPEDMPPQSGEEVPQEDLPHTSPGQQAITVAENAAQGALGPIATAYETSSPEDVEQITNALPPGKLGALGKIASLAKHYIGTVNPEDISARAEENPQYAIPAQVAGNISLLVSSPAIELANLGKRALKGAIETDLITANDEASKAILGKGDPASAVALKLAASTGVGLVTGALFNTSAQTTNKGLKALENAKIGEQATAFAAGIGHVLSVPEEDLAKTVPEGINNQKAFKWGQKFAQVMKDKTTKIFAKVGAAAVGGIFGHTTGAVITPWVEEALEHVGGKYLSKYAKIAYLKALSTGEKNIVPIIEHASALEKGQKAISKGVESLFTEGGAEPLNVSIKDREKLAKAIENNNLDQQITEGSQQQEQQQGFAKGGEVQSNQPDPVAQIYPEQNILINSAKSRISNYLNSVRPIKDPNKLPYDADPKTPQHEKDYAKVLDLANQPLSILNHVKKGTLLPEHMKHFTSMYPELYSHLSQKMTERIAKGQMKEEKKPPYHVRQSLSLFLGSTLDSTMTPQNIQAAQNVFSIQKAQKQVAMHALGKMGENSMTPNQSREKRLNKN